MFHKDLHDVRIPLILLAVFVIFIFYYLTCFLLYRWTSLEKEVSQVITGAILLLVITIISFLLPIENGFILLGWLALFLLGVQVFRKKTQRFRDKD
ncbi:hypothetical protein M3202_11785 [Alkalihalobacillus oceani]|uniref:Uncharacterized protein n=1 Tax=Halalkalibacter oceani TaxID=1653776 RepID=A0A9X2DPL9_9BACI|nr:hypothetical protein [Halalkalibacter oceani]MCM3714759.1 hypothetical protein [Halalkalibacter oceani]